MNFDVAFDRLLGSEGGYTSGENDPGGETNWGVTWPVLRESITLGLVPAGTTIKGLTRVQAKMIYLSLFWNRIHADKMYDGVAFQAFDFAVNSGIETAVRYLQRAVGVADDGWWGPVTQAAVAAMSESDIIMKFVAERLVFWSKLSTWPTFGKGWARRAAADLRYGAIDA